MTDKTNEIIARVLQRAKRFEDRTGITVQPTTIHESLPSDTLYTPSLVTNANHRVDNSLPLTQLPKETSMTDWGVALGQGTMSVADGLITQVTDKAIKDNTPKDKSMNIFGLEVPTVSGWLDKAGIPDVNLNPMTVPLDTAKSGASAVFGLVGKASEALTGNNIVEQTKANLNQSELGKLTSNIVFNTKHQVDSTAIHKAVNDATHRRQREESLYNLYSDGAKEQNAKVQQTLANIDTGNEFSNAFEALKVLAKNPRYVGLQATKSLPVMVGAIASKSPLTFSVLTEYSSGYDEALQYALQQGKDLNDPKVQDYIHTTALGSAVITALGGVTASKLGASNLDSFDVGKTLVGKLAGGGIDSLEEIAIAVNSQAQQNRLNDKPLWQDTGIHGAEALASTIALNTMTQLPILPSALSTLKPKNTTQTHTGNVVIGDSIAKQYGSIYQADTNITKDGRNPTQVLNDVKSLKNLQGKEVILSTGLSNTANLNQKSIIESQIQHLVQQGAKVRLVGVANNFKDNPQLGKELNGLLKELADKYNVEFLGGFDYAENDSYKAHPDNSYFKGKGFTQSNTPQPINTTSVKMSWSGVKKHRNIPKNNTYDSLMKEVYTAHGFTPAEQQILKAQVGMESNYNINAYNSSSKAFGLTQFIPTTAKVYGVKPNDARSQINGQALYMKKLLQEFDGDWSKAIAAYNTGEANVKKHWGKDGTGQGGGVMTMAWNSKKGNGGETLKYVESIVAHAPETLLDGTNHYTQQTNTESVSIPVNVLPEEPQEETVEQTQTVQQQEQPEQPTPTNESNHLVRYSKLPIETQEQLDTALNEVQKLQDDGAITPAQATAIKELLSVKLQIKGSNLADTHSQIVSGHQGADNLSSNLGLNQYDEIFRQGNPNEVSKYMGYLERFRDDHVSKATIAQEALSQGGTHYIGFNKDTNQWEYTDEETYNSAPNGRRMKIHQGSSTFVDSLLGEATMLNNFTNAWQSVFNQNNEVPAPNTPTVVPTTPTPTPTQQQTFDNVVETKNLNQVPSSDVWIGRANNHSMSAVPKASEPFVGMFGSPFNTKGNNAWSVKPQEHQAKYVEHLAKMYSDGNKKWFKQAVEELRNKTLHSGIGSNSVEAKGINEFLQATENMSDEQKLEYAKELAKDSRTIGQTKSKQAKKPQTTDTNQQVQESSESNVTGDMSGDIELFYDDELNNNQEETIEPSTKDELNNNQEEVVELFNADDTKPSNKEKVTKPSKELPDELKDIKPITVKEVTHEELTGKYKLQNIVDDIGFTDDGLVIARAIAKKYPDTTISFDGSNADIQADKNTPNKLLESLVKYSTSQVISILNKDLEQSTDDKGLIGLYKTLNFIKHTLYNHETKDKTTKQIIHQLLKSNERLVVLGTSDDTAKALLQSIEVSESKVKSNLFNTLIMGLKSFLGIPNKTTTTNLYEVLLDATGRAIELQSQDSHSYTLSMVSTRSKRITEQNKPFREQNLITSSFVQENKTNLAQVKNISSRLIEYGIKEITRLGIKKPNKKQKEQLEHYLGFEQEFKKHIYASFQSKSPQWQWQDLKGFFNIGDEHNPIFDENLITAMSLVAYDYISIKGGSKFTRAKDIAVILGLDSNDYTIPNFIMTKYADAGVSINEAIISLGRDVVKSLGLKAIDTAPQETQARLEASVGEWLVSSMQVAGLAHIKVYNATEVRNDANVVLGKEQDNQESYSTISTFTLHPKDIDTKEVDEIVDIAKDTYGYLSDLYGSVTNKIYPSLSPIEDVLDDIDKTNAKVAKSQQEIIKRTQSEPILLNQSMITLVENLQAQDNDLLLDLFKAKVPTQEELQEQGVHISERESTIKSAESNLRDFNNYLSFMNGLPTKDTPYYDRIKVVKNTRMHYTSNVMNFQTSKVQRALSEYANFKTDIDISNFDGQTWFDDKGNPLPITLFLRAVFENAEGTENIFEKALKKKKLSKGYTVDKLSSEYFAPTAWKYLTKDKKVARAVKAMRKLQAGNKLTNTEKKVIKELVDSWDMGANSFRALMEVTNLMTALENQQNTFTTSLGLGSDGVNNGTAIGTVLMGINDRLTLQRVGLFKKGDVNQNYYDTRTDTQIGDYYTAFGEFLRNAIDDIDTDNDVLNAIKGLNTSLDKRSMLKAILIPFGYGAGIIRLVHSAYERMLKDVYSTMTDIHKNNDTIAYDKLNIHLKTLLGKEYNLPPIDKLLEYEFDADQLKQLHSVYTYTMGSAIKNAINNYAEEFIKRRNFNIQIHDTVANAYVRAREHLLNKVKEEHTTKLKEQYKDVDKKELQRILEYNTLSTKDIQELVDKPLKKLFATLHTRHSLNEDTQGSIEFIDAQKTFRSDIAMNTSTWVYDTKTDSLKRSYRTPYIRDINYVSAGVTPNSQQIQEIDAFVSSQAMVIDDIVNINVHDANIGSILNYLQMANAQNKGFFEAVKDYHLYTQSLNALLTIIENLPEVMGQEYVDIDVIIGLTENFFNDTDIPYQAKTTGEFLKEIYDDVIRKGSWWDREKLRILEELASIHQYAGEAGQIKLTEKDYKAIQDAVDALDKQHTNLFERLDKATKQYTNKIDIYKDIPVFKPNQASEFTNHTGGAYGADTAWDIVGTQLGITNHKHYITSDGKLSKTLRDNKVKPTVLSEEDIKQGISEVNRLLNKNYGNSYDGRLQGRSYYQVNNSDGVYAIAKIKDNFKGVKGGTNTAVQLGIVLDKPVFVWDTEYERWYVYQPRFKRFIPYVLPVVLPTNFAGVGTRDIEHYGYNDDKYLGNRTEEKAKQAIQEVYTNSIISNNNIWFGSNENAHLSNLALRPFVAKNGRKYQSVEHFYQSHKTGKFNETLYNNPDWFKAGTKISQGKPKTENGFNLQLMKTGIKLSFEQNPQALAELLATDNTVFTHTQDKGIWVKEFPKLLMEVRDEFKSAIGVIATNLPQVSTPDRQNNHNVLSNQTQEIYQQLTHKTKDGYVVLPNDIAKGNIKTVAPKFIEQYPQGLIAYRYDGMNDLLGNFLKHRYIGNPFNWQKVGEEQAVKLFIDWLVTGNNYNNSYATEEYRKAIIESIDTFKAQPILYYKELNAPSHANALDYLINQYDWGKQDKSSQLDVSKKGNTTSVKVSDEVTHTVPNTLLDKTHSISDVITTLTNLKSSIPVKLSQNYREHLLHLLNTYAIKNPNALVTFVDKGKFDVDVSNVSGKTVGQNIYINTHTPSVDVDLLETLAHKFTHTLVNPVISIVEQDVNNPATIKLKDIQRVVKEHTQDKDNLPRRLDYFLGTYKQADGIVKDVGIRELFTIGLTNEDVSTLLLTIPYGQSTVYNELYQLLNDAVEYSTHFNLYGETNHDVSNRPQSTTSTTGQDRSTSLGYDARREPTSTATVSTVTQRPTVHQETQGTKQEVSQQSISTVTQIDNFKELPIIKQILAVDNPDKSLFEYLFGLLKTNNNQISIVLSDGLADEQGNTVGGKYDPTTNTITFNNQVLTSDKITTDNKVKLLNHEIIHALTETGLLSDSKAVQDLIKIYEHLKTKANNNYSYAFANINEFVAYGLTDKEFSQWIASNLDFKEITGLHHKPVNIIKKAYGVFLKIIHTVFKSKASYNQFINLVNAVVIPYDPTVVSTVRYSHTDVNTATDIVNGTKTTDIFKQLPTNVSEAHNTHLDKLIDYVLGSYQNIGKRPIVDLTQGKLKNTTLLNGFKSSDKEAYLTEALTIVFEEYLNNHKGVLASNGLTKLYHNAQLQFKSAKDFFTDYDNASKADKQRLTKMFNYVFNNKSKQNSIARFMAMSLVNEEFKNTLSNHRIKKQRVSNHSWFDKMMGLFEQVINALNDKWFNTKGRDTLAQVTALTNRLVALDIKARNTSVDNLQVLWQQGLDGINRLVEKPLKTAITKALSHSKLTHSKVQPIRILGKIGTVLKGLEDLDRAGHNAKFDELNAKLANSRFGIFLDTINEVLLHGKRGMWLDNMIRITQNIGRIRQRVKDSTITILNQAFNNELSTEQKSHITTVLLRTELSALLTHGFSMKETLSVLDKTKRQKYIDEYLHKLYKTLDDSSYANDMHIQIKSLAYYMAKEETVNNLVKSAEGIAIGLGTHKQVSFDEMDKDVYKLVDVLTTLYALDYTDSTAIAKVQTLSQEELHGIETTLKIHKGIVDKGKAEFSHNPYNYQKGYVVQVTDPQRKMVWATSQTDINQLINQGFEVVDTLLQDKDDNTDVRTLFIHTAYSSANYVSGALDLADSHHRGTAVYEKGRDDIQIMRVAKSKLKARKARMSIQARDYDPSKHTDALVATYATDGSILDYHYEMRGSTRDVYLNRTNAFDELLGRQNGNLEFKPHIAKQQRIIAQEIFKDSQENFIKSPDEFVFLDFDSQDEHIQEITKLMPYNFRQELKHLFDDDVIPIHKSAFTAVFGFNAFSVTQSFDRETSPNIKTKKIERFLIGLFKVLFRNKARTRALQAEQLVQLIMTTIKDYIVVRSGGVLLGNIISNILLLSLHGVNPVKIVTDSVFAWRNSKNYTKAQTRIEQINVQLLGETNTKKISQLKRELKSLQQSLDNNPMKAFIQAGLMSTIVEDIAVQDELYKTPVEQILDNYIQRIPKPIRNTIGTLTLAKGTYGHGLLAQATQFSDLSAKYTLAKHNMNKGMSLQEAIYESQINFINYDMPTNKFLDYMNRMGFMMFTKFFLRFQQVLAKMAYKMPITSLTQHIGIEYLGGQGIYEPFVLSRLGNPFDESVLLVDDAIDGLITNQIAQVIF